MTHDLENNSRYANRTIFRDKMCLVFPDSHSCAQTGKVVYNNLASETFLTLSPDVGPYVKNQGLHLLRSNNCFPSTIRGLDSMEELLFEVEAGFGFSILPARNQLSYQFPLTYIPLDGSCSEISIGVAWLPDSENPAVSWFIELMNKNLKGWEI